MRYERPRSGVMLDRQWRRLYARMQAGDPCPFIWAEIERRMVDRLSVLNFPDGNVVNHSFVSSQAFEGRGLRVFAPSFDQHHLQVPGYWDGWRRQASAWWAKFKGCADQDDSSGVSLIWSNGLLHRLPDPQLTLKAWADCLQPGGVVMFSCLGPDTAPVLRGAVPHWPDFADMHDIGDALVRAGFADPVMEMERMTLTYASPQQLLREWHEAEPCNLLDQPKGLCGRSRLERYEAMLAASRQAPGVDETMGRIPLVLEVVYGHAWRMPPRPRSTAAGAGVATVDIAQIGGRRKV